MSKPDSGRETHRGSRTSQGLCVGGGVGAEKRHQWLAVFQATFSLILLGRLFRCP